MSLDSPVEASPSDIRQFFHLVPPKRLMSLKDGLKEGSRGRRPRNGANMSNDKKPMNRWIIVLAAILIQLSLGAIYAWSVFTPPLSAPIADGDFVSQPIDQNLTLALDGKLKVGSAANVTLAFTNATGDPVTDFDSVTVSLELRDVDNEPVKSSKIVPYIGYVYDEGEPIVVTQTATRGADAYFVNPKVSKAGNWHYVVTAVRNESGTDVTYSFEILQPVGTGEFGMSITQTQMIFAVGLLTFAVFTIIGGRLAAKFGPRALAITGGIILGIGYILASLVGTNFYLIMFCIGVLGGAGIGLAYVVPIAVGVKWFPDKKGLVSGLAVAGFGFGALLWVKLCTGFIFGPLELSGDWPGLYGSYDVSQVFLIYGIAFLVSVVLGGLLMVNPPEGWKPEGWNPPEQTAKKASAGEFTSGEMMKRPQYYMLFFMFMVGAGSGLMVIGVIQLFGKYALMEAGQTAADAVVIAGTAFALFYSLSNGFGRIVWGWVSDKIGRKWAFVSMFGLQGVIMILFYFVAGNEWLLYATSALIGFNFGGNFALFPSATADFFGNKSVGLNYGWVFLSYGFGGILGPMLGGVMGDMEMWMWAFIPAGVACLVASGVGLLLTPPVPKDEAAPATDAPKAE